MSHTHEDRVADRPAHLCSAYGCPLMGTMTSSTTGASDWACALHANRPAGQLQQITVAINQHRWLAEAITDVRSMVPGRAGTAELLARIHHDCVAAGRPDLYWTGRPETVRGWTNRMEQALDQLVLPELLAQPAQAKLPAADTWQNAAAHVPLWA